MGNKTPNISGLQPFKKGISGNPNGRPKNSKPVKPMIEKLLENSFPAIEQDLATNPEARIGFFKDLTKLVLTANK